MCTTVDNAEIIILSDDEEEDKEDCYCSPNETSVLIVEMEEVKKNECVLSASALEEDLVVTFSRRAEVLPHARYDCPIHPFMATDNEVGAPVADNSVFCDQCFCYICDKLASSCEIWTYSGVCHSNSHKKSAFWSNQRNTALLGRLKSFNLTLSELDADLRQAEAMLQKFRKELSVRFSAYLTGKSVEECGFTNKQGSIHDYTQVYELISSFLNKADELQGKAAAILYLGAAEDFIQHYHPSGTLIFQSPTANAAQAKVILFNRVITSLQRQMVTAHFTPDFILKLQQFYKRLYLPAELRSMKNSLCVRPWDDILLVSVMKGQNVSGERKDKGKKDVLVEQMLVVLLRIETLQKQKRYRELCRYLGIVRADDSKHLKQIQDFIPYFYCLAGDFSTAVHKFLQPVNTPASRLTPHLFLFYFCIFKTATAPKVNVSQIDRLCYSGAVWEPIKDAEPMKRAELVKFAIRVQRCCSAVYADSQCWTALLSLVNAPSGSLSALPEPSPQFLNEAKDAVHTILFSMTVQHVHIPHHFMEVYPDQALLLLATGALAFRIAAGALSPALPVLNTFQRHTWALELLWETLTVERLSSFVQEVTQESGNTKDGSAYLSLLRARLPTLSSSTESWDHNYCSPVANELCSALMTTLSNPQPS